MGFVDGDTAPKPVGVVAPATGRLTVDLRGWNLIAAVGRSVMLVRPLASRSGAEVGLLAAGANTVRVRGRVAGMGTGCVGLDRTVLCREDIRRLTVWRVRSR
jgi:hypothetical protein